MMHGGRSVEHIYNVVSSCARAGWCRGPCGPATRSHISTFLNTSSSLKRQNSTAGVVCLRRRFRIIRPQEKAPISFQLLAPSSVALLATRRRCQSRGRTSCLASRQRRARPTVMCLIFWIRSQLDQSLHGRIVALFRRVVAGLLAVGVLGTEVCV